MAAARCVFGTLLASHRAALSFAAGAEMDSFADHACGIESGCFDGNDADDLVQLLQVQWQVHLPASPAASSNTSAPLEELNRSTSGSAASQELRGNASIVAASDAGAAVASGPTKEPLAEAPELISAPLSWRVRAAGLLALRQVQLLAAFVVLCIYALQAVVARRRLKSRADHLQTEREVALAKLAAAAVSADVLSPMEASAMADRELRCVFKDAPCCCLTKWRRFRSQWRMAGQKEEARLHGRVMLLLHGPTWESRCACKDEDACPDCQKASADGSDRTAESLCGA
eukprot:TRINITY_DN103261_c0_g1_i1.p1 TRINITY_DN103261_c0_g1~~TRINITY_DN103261_c0_g1_i1.p1  ORF type:complete len:287 (-),score=52.41 TRINITY_DN103261_c0_g1_i1:95-955(-)